MEGVETVDPKGKGKVTQFPVEEGSDESSDESAAEDQVRFALPPQL